MNQALKLVMPVKEKVRNIEKRQYIFLFQKKKQKNMQKKQQEKIYRKGETFRNTCKDARC